MSRVLLLPSKTVMSRSSQLTRIPPVLPPICEKAVSRQPSARAIGTWIANGLRDGDSRVCVGDSCARFSAQFYSDRNAIAGSTRAARRAGQIHAHRPMAKSRRITAANASGSSGDTCQSWLPRRRLSASAAVKPIATPIAISRNPTRSTSPITSAGAAPRAMRTPISCVRWETV